MYKFQQLPLLHSDSLSDIWPLRVIYTDKKEAKKYVGSRPLSTFEDEGQNNKIINEKGVSEEQGKIHAQIMEGIYETISSREKKRPFRAKQILSTSCLAGKKY